MVRFELAMYLRTTIKLYGTTYPTVGVLSFNIPTVHTAQSKVKNTHPLTHYLATLLLIF